MAVAARKWAGDAMGDAVDEDEEAFAWATASLGWARAHKTGRLERLMEAVVEDLAFGLGAGTARRTHRRTLPARGVQA